MHLISAIHFSDGLTNFVDERRAVTILYFDISKVFDTGDTWRCMEVILQISFAGPHGKVANLEGLRFLYSFCSEKKYK